MVTLQPYRTAFSRSGAYFTLNQVFGPPASGQGVAGGAGQRTGRAPAPSRRAVRVRPVARARRVSSLSHPCARRAMCMCSLNVESGFALNRVNTYGFIH